MMRGLVAAIRAGLQRDRHNHAISDRAITAKHRGNLPQHFGAIREIYALNNDRIMRGDYDPYLADWVRLFTPIEAGAWGAIRDYGLPFYPQYPADRYFLDFADPIKRIGLECDGRGWHNVARDTTRDGILTADGWRIFRIAGYEANAIVDRRVDAYRWRFESVEGIVDAINVVYYGGGTRNANHCFDCLDRHRLADFPI